jgi:hypothetical protein
MEEHVFYGSTNLTIYTDSETIGAGWNPRYNTSFRPVIYGCTLSDDRTYVVSVKIEENSIENPYAYGGISAPQREGFTFKGWALSDDTLETAYSAQEIINAPAGTVLYAVWIINN